MARVALLELWRIRGAFVRLGRMATDVRAHITGTVWKIEVKQGDRVEKGQTLVILESMKMEMPLEAETAGSVAKIHIAEGEAVEEGQTLLTVG